MADRHVSSASCSRATQGTGRSLHGQLELAMHGQWHAVRRYDTAHGFAHCDILHPDGGMEKIPLAFNDFNDALTFAEAELRAHWSLDVQRYAQEVERHE